MDEGLNAPAQTATDKLGAKVEEHKAKAGGSEDAFTVTIHAIDDRGRPSAAIKTVRWSEWDEVTLQGELSPGNYAAYLRLPGVTRNWLGVADLRVHRRDDLRVAHEDAGGRLDRIERTLESLAAAMATRAAAPTAPGGIDLIDAIAKLAPILKPEQPRDSLSTKDLLTIMVPIMQQRSSAGELAELMAVAQKIRTNESDGDSSPLTAFAPLLTHLLASQPTPTAHAPTPAAPPRPLQLVPAPQPSSVAAGTAAAVRPTAAAPQQRKTQPFPGAASIASQLLQVMPELSTKIDPKNMPAEVLEFVSNGVAEEIETAGGNPEDVADDFESGERLAGELMEFEPRLAPYTEIILPAAVAFVNKHKDPNQDAGQ